jgi:hypothetical protein
MSHIEGHFEGAQTFLTPQIVPSAASAAIIYRDIISHITITITYRYIMYFFRTFKKSTAPYKVHNMGLRYIKLIIYLKAVLLLPEFVEVSKISH